MREQQKNISKRRWLVLLFACLTNLCLGSVYAWSVFAAPMAEYLGTITGTGITTADLAIVYTVANSVGPITMISGGWINDRFGPKKVILTGGVMFGCGMILAGLSTSIGMLMVTYGLLGGLGLGMAYGCTISCCVKFFPDKRGLIGGLTTAAYGFSSVLLPPVINLLVEKVLVKMAFILVGLTFLVIISVSSLFMFSCPEGFVPEGWKAPEKQADGQKEVNKSWKEMLKSPIFYLMILLLMSGAFSGMMIISQASAVGMEMIGLSVAAAGIAVSVLALFNSFGRILAGFLSDKIGRVQTLTLACFLSVGGNVIMYLCSKGDLILFYTGISIVGICFGAFMGVFPGFTADQFGAAHNSVNYGIMFIGFAMAGYFGPTIMKNVYYKNGSYTQAFLIAAGLSVAGIVLTVLYRMCKKREK